MNSKIIGLAVAAALLPVGAFAQSAIPGQTANQVAPQSNNSHYADGTTARDGCENIPNEAHNPSDCSKVDASDTNTAMNRPTTDLSGRPTGATANAARNQRILSGQSSN